jgi:hypothetical protein
MDRRAQADLRARALRAHQGARGGVRRVGDRRGGRRSGGRPRSRRPSTSSSPAPATRRSRSSRSSARRPASVSRRPRRSSTRRPSPSRRASSARRPTSSRPISRRPAPPSRSSSTELEKQPERDEGRPSGRPSNVPPDDRRAVLDPVLHRRTRIVGHAGVRRPRSACARSRLGATTVPAAPAFDHPRDGVDQRRTVRRVGSRNRASHGAGPCAAAVGAGSLVPYARPKRSPTARASPP